MSGPDAPLTLIGYSAFRPFRNVWMLEELGVAYKLRPAMPLSAEAMQTNPLGKVPSLIDGDFTMYESAEINTYLGDKFRGQPGIPELVPAAGTRARGRYEQFVFVLMAEVDAQGLWIHRKHEALGKVFGTFPEAVAAARAHVHRVLGVLAAELQRSGDYLLGADFTAADILLVHCLDWAEKIHWLPPPDDDDAGAMANLHKYLDRCRGRSAYKRTAATKKEVDPREAL